MPKGFKHVDLNIRSHIFAFNATEMSAREIAQQTKFHHSTISREIAYSTINC